MSSAVVWTPSACIIWYLWPSTVRVDSPSAAPISFIVRPAAISRSTSRCRAVSRSVGAPGLARAASTSGARRGVM